MPYGEWEAVIGLEIHAQLITESKMFSSDSASYGGGDNEHTSPVSLGMPGALPVINEKAVLHSVRTGLALNCDIRSVSVFARKNYFYPDMPKGYQISQFEEPLCENGYVEFMIDDKLRRVSIARAHMEEDAGKSTHHGKHSLINLNRAGVPLLEIVSEPGMRTPHEAAEYARSVRRILRYLNVCDGNLEEGSLRCDCNISVRKKGDPKLGTKVELKNINSFRFVEKALQFEIERQIECCEAGQKIEQQTRLYDSTKNRTFAMRSKEEAHDYRYFSEPDLLPLEVSAETIATLRKTLPELPLAKSQRFQSEYGLSSGDAFMLTQDFEMASFFEQVATASGNPKASANWVMGELVRELNEFKLEVSDSKISSQRLARLIEMIDEKIISGKIAKQVFMSMWNEGRDPDEIVKLQGLVQITDTSAVESLVDEVIAANPSQVEEFRDGKEKLMGFFVGQIMKASKGQASPDVVNQILRKKLKR